MRVVWTTVKIKAKIFLCWSSAICGAFLSSFLLSSLAIKIRYTWCVGVKSSFLLLYLFISLFYDTQMVVINPITEEKAGPFGGLINLALRFHKFFEVI